MSFLSRAAREPLLHFLVVGVAVFAVYGMRDTGDETPRDRIVVTEGRVEQLAQVFSRTWQRPPTPEELRGLVDAWIREEVWYREAVRLGLDRDDTVIRRRMQQKMEFLVEPPDDALTPADGELEAFLADHRERFRIEPVLAFEQVFVSAERGRDAARARAGELLARLSEADPPADPASLGDASLLPLANPPSPLTRIAREYGAGFADGISDLPGGQWAGPVPSAYGLHLVRVTSRREGRDPSLDEVREAVLQEWRRQRRDRARREAYERLLAGYDVVVPDLAPSAVPPSPERR